MTKLVITTNEKNSKALANYAKEMGAKLIVVDEINLETVAQKSSLSEQSLLPLKKWFTNIIQSDDAGIILEIENPQVFNMRVLPTQEDGIVDLGFLYTETKTKELPAPVIHYF